VVTTPGPNGNATTPNPTKPTVNPAPNEPGWGAIVATAQTDADRFPRNQGAQSDATRYSYNNGDYESSYRYGQRYYKVGGADATTLDAAGRSATFMGDNDFAQKAGQRAAESDPSDKYAQALANLSQGHLGGVNVDGAIMKAGGGAMNAGAINAEGD